jgi:hypothetical protein
VRLELIVSFIDEEGNIIVPKFVRPIIKYTPTLLGEKKGSKRQYRLGNLHIREYSDHYKVHEDKIDPRTDPLGHILIDVPNHAEVVIMLGRIAKSVLSKSCDIKDIW